MADSEDWRRQRAESLRLHDAGPLAAPPARDRPPPVDGVEPMRRPVVQPPVQPPVPAPLLPPVTAASPGQREPRRGAEPAARRHRPQAPLPGSDASAPLAASSIPVSRGPAAPSFAARHPLALGSLIAAALAGAGALGWTLRGDTSPVPTIAPMARIVAPAAPAASAAPANRAAPPVAAPVAAAASLPSMPVSERAVEVVRPENIRDTAAPRTTKPAPSATVTKPPRSPQKRIVRASSSPDRPDVTSRFAHPAKAVALSGRDFHPSFNCRRAIAAVNRAICASPALSALDRQVSQAFYRVTATVDLERHKAIDRDQVDFLNERARCNLDDCVARVYNQRLEALREAAPGE